MNYVIGSEKQPFSEKLYMPNIHGCISGMEWIMSLKICAGYTSVFVLKSTQIVSSCSTPFQRYSPVY